MSAAWAGDAPVTAIATAASAGTTMVRNISFGLSVADADLAAEPSRHDDETSGFAPPPRDGFAVFLRCCVSLDRQGARTGPGCQALWTRVRAARTGAVKTGSSRPITRDDRPWPDMPTSRSARGPTS